MTTIANLSAKPTITQQLYTLFDALGLPATVAMAREVAAAHGLNTTSAEISFYRWRMLRGFYKPGTCAMSH